MNLGHTIEWLALTAALVGLAAQAAYLLQGRPLLRRVALGSALAAAALAALAYAYLTWAFMTSRLDIEYVFSYTKATYPWYYKLAGTWGAQKGTMLLWAALTGACLAIFALARSPASGRGEPSAHEFERARQWTLLFLVALFASFLFLVVRQDTFAPTPDFLLVSRPDGNGLSPVLQAPLSLFHPPAEFIAYALTAVPAAAGLAFLATGTPAWSRVCRTWARVTWALYTVGIGLGAIWAYYTLSFGGYWAWDPVEVANLIPWIVLTAFLHTRV
ncbi:MAG: cytochrome c biogenesis protein CcsA, partial [Candidatus Thermoplasmatota archaeon]